jgi:GGDEF domain-containing protein
MSHDLFAVDSRPGANRFFVNEPLTDPVTGLGNRHKLILDLQEAVRPNSPSILFEVFDLVGFAEHLQLYGRLRSQALLVRLARRLEGALEGAGTCYRPREGEFGVLVNAPISATKSLLGAAVEALRQREEHVTVRAAFGAAMLPDEASDVVGALRLVDERLSSNAPRRRTRNRRS